jgi:hypothetical protein
MPYFQSNNRTYTMSHGRGGAGPSPPFHPPRTPLSSPDKTNTTAQET